MNDPSTGRLRPIYARGLFLAGLASALVPLSRRFPKAQTLLLELPSRLHGAPGKVEVAYTRDGDSEPLGGYTLAFPSGAPRTVRREISAPDGRYRLDVSLDFGAGEQAKQAKTAKASILPVRNEVSREVSFTGTDIRVILEDTPP